MPFATVSEACPHAWDDAAFARPRHGAVVHRDECAYCCRTCRHGDGVYVCMACHSGLCVDHLDKHMALHPAHVMYTRIHELPPPPPSDAAADGHGDHSGSGSADGAATVAPVRDAYYVPAVRPKEYDTDTCCARCRVRFAHVPEMAVAVYADLVHAPVPGAVDAASNDADGSGGGGYVQRPICPHLVSLEQLPSPYAARGRPPTSDDACDEPGCGCTLNNWMCVTCGAIGCPRAEAGGHAHAVAHYHRTQHPCVVKLGTITPAGADFYCYECDDDVADGYFEAHMRHFGIDVATATKTAKTMGELAYDYSTQFDFNKITEAGSELRLAYGPGRTGMRNIGNSCYLASVVQCLIALPVFARAFYAADACAHQQQCRADPYACRHCQTERIAAGLLSGEFSQPPPPQTTMTDKQTAEVDTTGNSSSGNCGACDTNAAYELNGVSPRQFKAVYAQQHSEFATGAQQDAHEYLLYLLEEMRRFVAVSVARGSTPPPAAADGGDAAAATTTTTTLLHPSQVCELVTEHRIRCVRCGSVNYHYNKEYCVSLTIPDACLAEAAAATTATAATVTTDATAVDDDDVTNKKACADATAAPARPRVSLDACLQTTFGLSNIDCQCEACGQASTYESTTRLASFPDVLVLSVRRVTFDMATLSAKKLDVYVDVPEEVDLAAYKGNGLQPGEIVMRARTHGSRDSAAAAAAVASHTSARRADGDVDEVAVATLLSMGVDAAVARFALQQTDMNVERAVDYIFSHPDIDRDAAAAAAAATTHDASARETRNDVADASTPVRAATDGAPRYRLVSMISHMGASAKSGHYVCHLRDRDTGAWLLVNDEKVGYSHEPPFSMASIYFFARCA